MIQCISSLEPLWELINEGYEEVYTSQDGLTMVVDYKGIGFKIVMEETDTDLYTITRIVKVNLEDWRN